MDAISSTLASGPTPRMVRMLIIRSCQRGWRGSTRARAVFPPSVEFSRSAQSCKYADLSSQLPMPCIAYSASSGLHAE